MSTPVQTTEETPRPGFWARWKWHIIAVMVLTPLACIGFFIFVVHRYYTETVPGVHAQEDVIGIVVQYLVWHNDAWPRCWEDLEEAHEAWAARGRRTSLHELKRLVAIDFTADTAELKNAQPLGDEPPFRVIWLRSGRQAYFNRCEPNRLVWDYLQGRHQGFRTQHATGRLDSREKQARVALIGLRVRLGIDANGRITEATMNSPVNSPQYSDADLRHLKALHALQKLDLCYSNVSDAGLEYLKELCGLRSIYMYGTHVTDDGLRHLRNNKAMDTLALADPHFTDAALEHIIGFANLRVLNLNGSRVTDQGLAKLYGMKQLEEVMLYNTGVSDDGVQRFKDALPNCKVSR